MDKIKTIIWIVAIILMGVWFATLAIEQPAI